MKAKVQIKSIFEQISEQVFTAQSLTEAKTFIYEFVNGKEINENDKKTILYNVSTCKNLTRLQQYICNSLLRYEGMGVGAKKES